MYRLYKDPSGLIISLPDNVYDEICSKIAKYYPNECGGIFVGTIDAKKGEAVITRMKMPRRFKSTPIIFRRLASFLNRWLDTIFKESKGDELYLGEWHSHPNGTPFPSQTDYNTMQRIAESGDTRIKTPVLLIVGVIQGILIERFYVFSQSKLVPYQEIKDL